MGTLVTGTAATYVEELWIKTDKRYEIMCITQDVQNVIKQSESPMVSYWLIQCILQHRVMLMILNLAYIMTL